MKNKVLKPLLNQNYENTATKIFKFCISLDNEKTRPVWGTHLGIVADHCGNFQNTGCLYPHVGTL